MRPLADAERVREFLRALGREAEGDTALYLTGGADELSPRLYRYPAIDPGSFRRALEAAVR
jgi:hypothetical protein